MKITLEIVKVGWPGPKFEKLELECKGSGTETDPAIIEPSEDLPKYHVYLKDSNIFIIIQNCFLERIILESCQNIRIENCNVWSITIQHCSKIFMKKSTIRRTLSLWESNHVKIENCTINRLKIHVSNSNTIKKCTIKKIKYVTGNDNIFEVNRIPERHLAKIRKRYWYNKYDVNII